MAKFGTDGLSDPKVVPPNDPSLKGETKKKPSDRDKTVPFREYQRPSGVVDKSLRPKARPESLRPKARPMPKKPNGGDFIDPGIVGRPKKRQIEVLKFKNGGCVMTKTNQKVFMG